MDDNQASTQNKPSAFEKAIGLVFAFLVFALIAYTIIADIEIDDNKMPLLYILISLMAGAMVATIPGFLNINYTAKGMTIRAAGGVAAFVMVLSALQEMAGSAQMEEQFYNGIDDFSSTFDNVDSSQSVFSATSYCSLTGVYGYATSQNLEAAQNLAIQNCVQNGGIPNCCANGTQVSQQY